ncbi:MAG TPA: hypothetical protein VFQ53_09300 [Kofleriaceae bacterium]|nr:hypothetical protein [Kofleriaceae bacterium]
MNVDELVTPTLDRMRSRRNPLMPDRTFKDLFAFILGLLEGLQLTQHDVASSQLNRFICELDSIKFPHNWKHVLSRRAVADNEAAIAQFFSLWESYRDTQQVPAVPSLDDAV